MTAQSEPLSGWQSLLLDVITPARPICRFRAARCRLKLGRSAAISSDTLGLLALERGDIEYPSGVRQREDAFSLLARREVSGFRT